MLLGIEFPSGRLWSEHETSLGFMTDVSWLTVRSRGLIECGVVAGHRQIGKSIPGKHVGVLSWLMKMLNEHSRNGANYS